VKGIANKGVPGDQSAKLLGEVVEEVAAEGLRLYQDAAKQKGFYIQSCKAPQCNNRRGIKEVWGGRNGTDGAIPNTKPIRLIQCMVDVGIDVAGWHRSYPKEKGRDRSSRPGITSPIPSAIPQHPLQIHGKGGTGSETILP
jgi:hypothetical protein